MNSILLQPVLVLVGLMLCAGWGFSNELARDLKRAPLPAMAVAVALKDAQGLGDHAELCRYIFINQKSESHIHDCNVVLNMVLGSSPTNHKCYAIKIDGGFVLRVDFEALSVDRLSAVRLAKVWEQMAADEPYFLKQDAFKSVVKKSFPTGKESLTVQFAEVVDASARVFAGRDVLVRPIVGDRFELIKTIKHDDGQQWHRVKTSKGDGFILASQSKVVKSRLGESSYDDKTISAFRLPPSPLEQITNSSVPIVRFDYFIRKAMSTLDDGLYYKFRGITKSTKKGVSDLDFALEKFAGVTETDVRKLASDRKVAMFRSNVTGKPRAAVLFSGIQGRISTNQGLVVVTHDTADNQNEANQDPILNLVQHAFDGTEVFIEMQNGHIMYLLFTGDLDGDGKYDPAKGEGELVDSAPDNLVKDHTVPAPHTARLQPAISCVRCHAQTKSGGVQPDGWIDLRNDVNQLVAGGLDIYGERTDGFPDKQTINRLAGLYAGKLDKPIQRARDDLAEVLASLTGEVSTKEQSVVTKVHGRIAKTYQAYWYDMVSPRTALFEIGIEAEDDVEAVGVLRKLFPPSLPDEIGIRVVDPRIGALRAGVPINRQQWEKVYGDAIRIAGFGLRKLEGGK